MDAARLITSFRQSQCFIQLTLCSYAKLAFTYDMGTKFAAMRVYSIGPA